MSYYGHGNCARIPALSDYDQAKAHYERVKPIRGRIPEVKPLGTERRFTWYQIRQNTIANQYENTEYHTYACQLYNTDCVEFYPNGDITLRTAGWHSITTKAFIGYVMRDVGTLISESGKWYFINRKGQNFLFKNELQLKRDENGELVAKQEVQEYKQSIDRKAMGKYRRLYKSFSDYGRTMLSMSNEITLSDVESLEDSKFGFEGKGVIPYYAWQSQATRENRRRFFKLLDEQLVSGDIELLYALASYVARSSGYYVYSKNVYRCEPTSFVNKFEEMIKHEFRDEIFKAEPVPMGTIFNDRNKKYFI